jgi:hypothetical protein
LPAASGPVTRSRASPAGLLPSTSRASGGKSPANAHRPWLARAENGRPRSTGRQSRGEKIFLTPPGAERKVVLWTPFTDRELNEDSGRYEWYNSGLARGTWQASQRNTINVPFDYQRACNCYGANPGTAQEAQSDYKFQPNTLTQVTWSSPRTNRLLLEAGSAARFCR